MQIGKKLAEKARNLILKQKKKYAKHIISDFINKVRTSQNDTLRQNVIIAQVQTNLMFPNNSNAQLGKSVVCLLHTCCYNKLVKFEF